MTGTDCIEVDLRRGMLAIGEDGMRHRRALLCREESSAFLVTMKRQERKVKP